MPANAGDIPYVVGDCPMYLIPKVDLRKFLRLVQIYAKCGSKGHRDPVFEMHFQHNKGQNVLARSTIIPRTAKYTKGTGSTSPYS
jgi:hypothetical protein